MDLKQFTTDAIRTESRIEQVQANKEILENLINAYIGIGNLLDQVKKNVFYGKPFDMTKYMHNFYAAQDALNDMTEQHEKAYIGNVVIDPNSNKETIDINTRLFHAIIGIATESSEMVEAIQKAFYGEELDWINVGEENGDLGWYQAIMMDELGLDWNQVLVTVIEKLKARYPDAFDADKAINRDLDTERNILENGIADAK